MAVIMTDKGETFEYGLTPTMFKIHIWWHHLACSSLPTREM